MKKFEYIHHVYHVYHVYPVRYWILLTIDDGVAGVGGDCGQDCAHEVGDEQL